MCGYWTQVFRRIQWLQNLNNTLLDVHRQHKITGHKENLYISSQRYQRGQF